MCAAAVMVAYCSGPIGEPRPRHVGEPLFQPLTPDAARTLADLFRDAWHGDAIDDSRWQAAGFQRTRGQGDGGSYLEVSERSPHPQGLGSYLLRVEPHAGVLLEALHKDDDLYTGEIVRHLFLAHRFAGAGFNSLSRWSVDRHGRSGDLARREDTALAAFGAGFLAAHAGATIVQIHGFDAMKRGEASFTDADIVISNGTDDPDAVLLTRRDCLDRLLPGRVLLYPADTRELGGTRNATGQLIRRGGGNFLHLELSLDLRRRLRSDAGLAVFFAACLLGDMQS